MCLTLKITTHGNGIPNIDSNDIFFKNSLTDLDLSSLDNCVYLDMEEYDKTTLKTDDLNVLQLNVCGLINKQAELNKILTDGSINKVNVALLCETWLRSETKNLINLPTYSYIGKERKGKKRWGSRNTNRQRPKIQEQTQSRNPFKYLRACCCQIKM